MHSARYCVALGAAFALLTLARSDSLQSRGLNDLPLVTTDGLISRISLDEILVHEQQLEDFAYAYPARNRYFGGPAHNDTVWYIYNTIKATGAYDIHMQELSYIITDSPGVLTVNGVTLQTAEMSGGPDGNVTAPVVAVSSVGCDAADYPPEVKGNIALILRGTCPFQDKVALAGAAGAVGALVYNNGPGPAPSGSVDPSDPLGPYVPSVIIGQTDGLALISALANNSTVTASLSITTFTETVVTYNVIAQTLSGDQDNVVSLGAHTDSVAAGPGINDDGSGATTLLELAKALSNYSVNNAVRFCWWTGEEEGLLGSNSYIWSLNATEIAKIKLYMNFDMLASPNYYYAIYDGDGAVFGTPGPAGSTGIENLFKEYYDTVGVNYTATEFDGRSDYSMFFNSGIPCGGLFTGAEQIKTADEVAEYGGQAGIAYDACYHQACDNMTNLALEPFKINADAVAYAVGTYALSLDGLATNSTRSTAVKADSLRTKPSPSVPKVLMRDGNVLEVQ